MDATGITPSDHSHEQGSVVSAEEEEQIKDASIAIEGPPGLAIFSQPNTKPLDVDIVVEILKNVEKYSSVACNIIPPNPKAGNVFLFVPTTEEEQGFYRKDQFMWVNHGPKAIPAKDPVIQKRYYVAKLPDGRPSRFHKSVYTMLNDIRVLKPCIVQYMGSTDGVSLSTKKSRIQAEKLKETTGESPTTQGNKKTIAHHHARLLSMTQPITLQHKKLAISKDDATHLHELAYSMSGFIHSIQIAPTFQCILGLKDLSDHLETMLQINENANEAVLFSYSNSFEIGSFVVSPLLFTHVAFDGKPAIPSHVIIHEKGDHLVHNELFRVVLDMVPSFGSVHAAIVTEADQHKDDCIAQLGLNLIPISSWREVISSTKEWMYANKATQQEVATGIDDLRKLMSSQSIEEYEDSLGKCKENWGPAMQEYYMSKVDQLAKTKLGRWLLEPWDVFNPYTGVCNKSNDSLEIVIQHLQALGDASANSIAMACYLMQHYVRKEIKDGANGMGRLVAKNEMNGIYRDGMASWKPIPFLCLPENVVHYVKEDQIVVQEGNLVERKGGDAKKVMYNKGKRIYEAGNVHHNVSIQAFLVKDLERPDENFLVKLFPRATCSCDSAMFCQHIIAVKISIGVDMESEMERLDLKFVTRALRSCENAAEGIKTRRRRKKRPISETNNFVTEAKRVLGEKGEAMSEGEEESDNENELSVNAEGNHQVDFFHTGEQVTFFP